MFHPSILSALLICLCAIMTTPHLARAQIAMQGSFIAKENCPALQSIRKRTNPGDVMVSVSQSYTLLGKNKAAASHYWIEVPGAKPLQRWVAVSCGTANGEAAKNASPSTDPKVSSDSYILAVSWQPAFCEEKADKPECKNQTATRYDSSNFTLHGLWPQPRQNIFCGVTLAEKNASDNRRWADLPDLRGQIDDQTEAALDQVMPGTQSYLERHEWTKHGTCYPARNPQAYYNDSVRLMQELNTSAAQALMAANIGKTITTAQFRTKFDETFGPGAGDRLRMSCKQDGNRRLLVEITIGLKGDIPAGTKLKDLLSAAAPTDPGCQSFEVDAVGLQ
jgi:ribonuclease T2